MPNLNVIKLIVASLEGTRSIDILQAYEINVSPNQDVRRLFLTNYYSFNLKISQFQSSHYSNESTNHFGTCCQSLGLPGAHFGNHRSTATGTYTRAATFNSSLFHIFFLDTICNGIRVLSLKIKENYYAL